MHCPRVLLLDNSYSRFVRIIKIKHQDNNKVQRYVKKKKKKKKETIRMTREFLQLKRTEELGVQVRLNSSEIASVL